MKLKFWGVRGSIPTPISANKIREKIEHVLEASLKEDLSSPEKRRHFLDRFLQHEVGTVGGDTSCVEILSANTRIILDMGSGLVRLGNHIMKQSETNGNNDMHIFISHTHWDHIMGFPMFKPAFFPQFNIKFYGVHKELEKRLVDQQDNRFFPVALNHMASSKDFVQLEADQTVDIDGIKVTNTLQHHPGGSYAYRIDDGTTSVVYATDSQYVNLSSKFTDRHVEFFRNADLLIFDAMYTFEEAIHREDYGHSSAITGIDLAIRAGVKRLALFHHEPDNDDATVFSMLRRALNYKKVNYPKEKLEVFLALEGLSVEL